MTTANDLSDRQFIAAAVLSRWPDQTDADAGLHLIELRNRYAVSIAREAVARKHAEFYDEPFESDAPANLDHFREADLLVQEASCDCADDSFSVLAFLRSVAAGER